MKKHLTLILLGLLCAIPGFSREVWLTGSMNNWIGGDGNPTLKDEWKFKPCGEAGHGDNHQLFECELEAGDYEFKIYDKEGSAQWNGKKEGNKIELGSQEDLGWGWGNNIELTLDKKYKLTFDYWNKYDNTAKLTVTGKYANESDYVYNLTGSYNNWGNNGVERGDLTSYTWYNIPLYTGTGNTGGFKIKVWDGQSDTYYGCGDIDLDSPTTTTTSGNDIKVKGNNNASQLYDITYDFTTKKVTVSKSQLYVMGRGVELSWEFPGHAYKVDSEGYYTFTLHGLTEFKISRFRTTADEGWDKFNGDNRVGAWNSNVTNTGGQKFTNLSPSNGNNKMPWKGTYTIRVKEDMSEIIAMSPGQPTYWEIEGQFENSETQKYNFVPSADDENIWTTAFMTPQGGGSIKINKYVGAYSNPTAYYPIGRVGIDGTYNTQTSGSATYALKPGMVYLFTWNSKDNTLSVEQSKIMYLYGHHTDGYWEPNNYVELMWDETTNTYVNNYVEITGCWSQHDVDIAPDKDRTKYEPTDGINYVALYGVIQTEDDFHYTVADNGEPKLYKFGAFAADCNADDGNNCQVEKNKAYKLDYQLEKTNHNFLVANGSYSVTFDPSTGTVTFGDSQTKTRTLVWYSGDNDNDDKHDAKLIKDKTENHESIPSDFDDHYHYKFVYGDTKADVVQAGVEGNAAHKLARQVDYQVWYRPASARPAVQSLKRRVSGTVDGDALEAEGYGPAVKSTETQTNDYTQIGSNDYYDNHLIQLDQPGDYVITATVSNEAKGISEYEGYAPVTLFATVAAESMTITPNYDPTTDNTGSSDPTASQWYRPFDPSGTVTLKDAVKFSSTPGNLDDYTVTLSPVDVSTWAIGENTDAAYEAALGKRVFPEATLYQQWQYLGGTNAKLDGFYPSTNTNLTAALKAGSETNAYNIEIPAPCSGVYQMTITPNSAAGVEIANAADVTNMRVEIYPNLYGTFGVDGYTMDIEGRGDVTSMPDEGFNINGYTFTAPTAGEDSNYYIHLNPTILSEGYFHGYVPGSYFLSALTSVTDETEEPANGGNSFGSMESAKKVKRQADGSNYYTNVDLSYLVSNPSYQGDLNLTVTAEKNGAKGVFPFKVNLQTGIQQGSTTGVDAITTEEGEAVYFNLQGVRVENPEHGIYVKVQDGKASKVVL